MKPIQVNVNEVVNKLILEDMEKYGVHRGIILEAILSSEAQAYEGDKKGIFYHIKGYELPVAEHNNTSYKVGMIRVVGIIEDIFLKEGKIILRNYGDWSERVGDDPRDFYFLNLNVISEYASHSGGIRLRVG